MTALDITTPDKVLRIRELNMKLRSTFTGGVVLISEGVAALSPEVRAEVMRRVREFHYFSRYNDPHGEADMGMFDIVGSTFMFAISYFDLSLDYHSPDPADPEVTRRVMWVGYAHER